MANLPAGKKLHSLSKSERLCNFSFKNILFKEGESFQQYPFRVFWKTLDTNLENIFFRKSVTMFAGEKGNHPAWLCRQNPSYPFKKVPENALFSTPVKCLFGASVKVHKSAADRNHIKRLIREAYRQNKAQLYTFLEEKDTLCLIAFIYTAGVMLPYHDIEAKMIVSLQKIQQKILEQPNPECS